MSQVEIRGRIQAEGTAVRRPEARGCLVHWRSCEEVGICSRVSEGVS